MTNTLLIVTIFVVVLLSIAGAAYAIFSPALQNKERASRRLKSVSKNLGTADDGARLKSSDTAKERRKAVQDKLQELESEQKRAKTRNSIKDLIHQSGMSFSLTAFYVGSLIFGVVVGLTVWLTGNHPYVAAGAAFVGVVGIPRWVVGFLAKRRKAAFSNEFANAVDIIVRGVKSGLPVNECLQIIARESPAPVGPEFREMTNDLKVGVPLDRALDRLYERVPTPELNFFVIVLTIQQQTGGNLAETLSNLSTVLRQRKIMKEKIKALSAEAKSSAWIIGSLPPIVVVMITMTTPGYLDPMFDTKLGNAMLVGAGFWMLAGILSMKKMVSFKY